MIGKIKRSLWLLSCSVNIFFSISVQYLDHGRSEKVNVRVIGDGISLKCESSCEFDEKLPISWMRDGVELPSDNEKYLVSTDYRLAIINSSVEDSGNYNCHVGSVNDQQGFDLAEYEVTIDGML